MAIVKSLRSSRLFRLAPLALAAACLGGTAWAASAVNTVPGMPPVVNPANMYSESGLGHLSPVVKNDPARIYVPNLRSNDVYVIDPATYKVVDKFKVGAQEKNELLSALGGMKGDIVGQ